MRKPNIYQERTSLRTSLIAVLVGLVGILLVTAADNYLSGHPSWQTPIRDLGGLLFASVAVAVLWELFAKRAFLAELMNAAQIAEDIKAARLLNVTTNFLRDIKWDELFHNANEVIVLFCYGHPFRNYEDVLEEFVSRPKRTSLQVMLPDPEDEKVMFELARRFGGEAKDISMGILKTVREFKTAFSKAPERKEFSIWYLSFAPVFSYYIFDDTAVLSLYKHQKDYVSMPAFVFARGGRLYDFVKREHDAIVKPSDSLAKQVFPEITMS